MANETVYSGGVNLAAWIDAGIMEVLRTTNVMLGLGYRVEAPKGSSSKKMRKRDGQTAAVVSEATAATSAQYTHTAQATLTAKKVMVLNEPSKEALKFSDINWEEIRTEQGLAISEKVDTDMAALFSGFSNSVGSTGTAMTIDNILKSAYYVRLANVPGSVLTVLHVTQVYHVQSALITAGAAAFSNPTLLDLLGAQPAIANGYRGSIFGIPIFETQHTPSANTNTDWCGATFNAQYGIAFLDCGPAETDEITDVTKKTYPVSTDFFFDTKERLDGAGCGIISKQAV